MNVVDLVSHAIKNKQIVTATYGGHRRRLCPHVIGEKNGKVNCLFYQFGGLSDSGLSRDSTQNWRCIKVELLTDVSVSEGEWHTADNHSRQQPCVDVIYAEVPVRYTGGDR